MSTYASTLSMHSQENTSQNSIMCELKYYRHTPPHLFVKDTKYFITAKTYEGKLLLSSPKIKNFLIDSIEQGFKKRNWELEDWAVLNNHYHIMVNVNENAELLPDIMNEIHKFTALWIKKNDNYASNVQRIWYNYWDKCISYEKSYFTRLNYIWSNPVKHGYVDDASQWEFGSYYHRFKDENEYLYKIRTKYPCDKLLLEDID